MVSFFSGHYLISPSKLSTIPQNTVVPPKSFLNWCRNKIHLQKVIKHAEYFLQEQGCERRLKPLSLFTSFLSCSFNLVNCPLTSVITYYVALLMIVYTNPKFTGRWSDILHSPRVHLLQERKSKYTTINILWHKLFHKGRILFFTCFMVVY